MNDKKLLLDMLLSNDISKVNNAIISLLQHAKQYDTWAIDVVETAISKMSGKDKIEFYKPQREAVMNPIGALLELGDLIAGGNMLNDITNTQKLIIQSGEVKNNLEDYFLISPDTTKSRIVYAILGIQMQISIMLGR